MVTVLALTNPQLVTVKRSELRQNQRRTLKRATGSTIVLISANDAEETKLVLDKRYFDELLAKLRAAAETLAITMDGRLYPQILEAAKTLDEDVRLGKLHTPDEAFGER